MGCVSQDSYPRKSIPCEPGKLESKHAVKFSIGALHQIKIRERVRREELSQSVDLISVVLARPNSGKDHMRRPCTKKDASAEQHGIWRTNIHKLQNSHNATLCTPIEARVMPASTHFEKTRGARIRSRFRSINAHDKQKRHKLS